MRTGHVIERTVGEVFEAAGHPGSVVFFQTRQVDDFVRLGRDDAGEIGSSFTLSETIHLTIDVRIVSAASLSLHRPPLIQPDDADAWRDQRVIPNHLELI